MESCGKWGVLISLGEKIISHLERERLMGEETERLRSTAGATFPKSGELFEGRYRVGPMIGAGGFARVYKAQQEDLGREVALKILTPGEEGDYDAKLVERFDQEARVVSRLRDPHTITMFDYGRTSHGLLYMVFEYVNGVSLSKLISTEAPLPGVRAVKLLRQVLFSLEEAHALGMLHRDIKPGNIMVFEHVGRRDQVKLLDFGIAKMTGTSVKADLTADGALIGTPRYMSPEQIRGAELTPQSDVYSLGLVAYELLMGRKAIESNSSVTIIGQQLDPNSFVLPPMTNVPEGLRRVVNKMMAKDTRQRYLTCSEVLTALESWEESGTQGLFEISTGESTQVLMDPPENRYDSFPDISDEVVPIERTYERQNRRSTPNLTPVPDPARQPSGRYSALPEGAYREPSGVFTHPSEISRSTEFRIDPTYESERKSKVLVLGGIGFILVVIVGLALFSALREDKSVEQVAVAETGETVVKGSPVENTAPAMRRFLLTTNPPELGVMINGRQMGLSPLRLDEAHVQFPMKVRVMRGDEASEVFEFKTFQSEITVDARQFVASLEPAIATQEPEQKTQKIPAKVTTTTSSNKVRQTQTTKTEKVAEKKVEEKPAEKVEKPAEKTKINLPPLDF